MREFWEQKTVNKNWIFGAKICGVSIKVNQTQSKNK